MPPPIKRRQKEARLLQKRKLVAEPEEPEEEDIEMEEEEEVEENEENSDVCTEDLCMHDIVGPVRHFKERYWGKSVFMGQMWDAGFEKLKKGFGDGELSNVLQYCRKDDNTRYTPSEMDTLEDDFLNGKKTVNMPLCFTEGADELRNAFLAEFPNLGNDVEVGVYFSRTGGEIAQWHSDNNHNITIQVSGTKEWHCRPGSRHTERSKALTEAPKNFHDQRNSQLDRRSASAFPPQTYVLDPGTVIYLPPGHWHSVVSTGEEDSFSIDIRVGNIVHAKWIAEAMYNGLFGEFHGTAGASGLALSKEDYQQQSMSKGISEQARYLRKHVVSMLNTCPPIPSIPFERERSNGFHRGATISWLLEKLQRNTSVQPPFQLQSRFGLHPMIALSVKLLPNYCILYMFSESTLTTMEYIRYSLFCSAFLDEVLQSIVGQTQITYDSLVSKCPSGEEYTNALQDLVWVLLKMGVLLAHPIK
eukprot:TRINITY_DN21671_c0_g1_i1.p1 TRINITY_DN21671_c0_g1~~TRINITY_DN21671_c0_g1_i1.p1  ORF type:complete len:485 (+),score=112.18 TRINITY_DN21671_c0_g1_i1:38-1456(+)